jgi:hypothetical protein
LTVFERLDLLADKRFSGMSRQDKGNFIQRVSALNIHTASERDEINILKNVI